MAGFLSAVAVARHQQRAVDRDREVERRACDQLLAVDVAAPAPRRGGGVLAGLRRRGYTPEAIRGWVANRFYYQRSIPLKDAAIISNCPLREVRRSWLRRIVDHDGSEGEEGGIEAWLRLGEACGLSRDRLLSGVDVVAGVRFAVDAFQRKIRRRIADLQPMRIGGHFAFDASEDEGALHKRLAEPKKK